MFEGSVVVDPGIYTLRLAAVDDEGRRGSVVREVSAWKMQGETLAFGDLVIGMATGAPLRPAVEPHVAGEALGAYLELYSNAPNTFDKATVTIDVADDADAKPLITTEARVVPGQTGATRQVSGVIPTNVLPPGRYVVRGGGDAGRHPRPACCRARSCSSGPPVRPSPRRRAWRPRRRLPPRCPPSIVRW